MKEVMIYSSCISGNEASQIAKEDNLKEEWMGAKSWFEGIVESDDEFELDDMPKYNRFICHMDYIDSDLYYDYGADYYFAVLNKLKTENMKKRIRLTESDLHRVIKESVNQILSEISYNTVSSAVNKMNDLGQYNRADELGEKYNDKYTINDNRPYETKNSWWEIKPFVRTGKIIVYETFKNGEMHSYKYNVKRDGWDTNGVPKMTDKRFAVQLANYIKQINPNSEYANKNCYIK